MLLKLQTEASQTPIALIMSIWMWTISFVVRSVWAWACTQQVIKPLLTTDRKVIVSNIHMVEHRILAISILADAFDRLKTNTWLTFKCRCQMRLKNKKKTWSFLYEHNSNCFFNLRFRLLSWRFIWIWMMLRIVHSYIRIWIEFFIFGT